MTHKLPQHLTQGADGRVRDRAGSIYEFYEGLWREVVDASRSGWWRYHRHYDRHGYCDNPSRGY